MGYIATPDLTKALNNFYEETKFAIIGEPSMMEPIIGQKAIYIMDTYVNGSAGQQNKQEVSAIHEAMRLILWLENKMASLIKEGRIDKKFNPPHSSIHIGVINGSHSSKCNS